MMNPNTQGTATEHSFAFVSIDIAASLEEAKAFLGKFPCTIFVNVVSTEFVDGDWRRDDDGATSFLQKLVPAGFSSKVFRQLAIMWPSGNDTTTGYKLRHDYRVQAQELRTSWHSSLTCHVEPMGASVCNVSIGKVNSRPALCVVLKQCGKGPFIIGGGIEAVEHLLAMYVKDFMSSDVRILTTRSRYPECKCIVHTPGMVVKEVSTGPENPPDINSMVLVLQ